MSYRQWAEVTDRGHAVDSPAVVLLLVQDLDQGGWFLRGYDRSGRETVETWHGGLVPARQWAASHYGSDAVGLWHDIPDDAGDLVRYALRKGR
jgi:hypothetical protein